MLPARARRASAAAGQARTHRGRATRLAAGTTRSYRVRAVNAGGAGDCRSWRPQRRSGPS